MKAEWERSTRVCATIDLPPDLLAAIRGYIEFHELGPAEAQALICFETVSRRLKKPSLVERLGAASHKFVTRAAIVTPTRLLWAERADDDEAHAHGELLAGLGVTDYEKGPAFAMSPDHGVEVTGIRADQGRTGMLFFGFGEGPDADRARLVLKDAVRAAHGEGPPVAAGGATGQVAT